MLERQRFVRGPNTSNSKAQVARDTVGTSGRKGASHLMGAPHVYVENVLVLTWFFGQETMALVGVEWTDG
jgi:hypothetical protein